MNTKPSLRIPCDTTRHFLIALLLVVCGIVTPKFTAAASSTKKVHFCHSTTNLLPGSGIDACENITAPGCSGGTPSAQAYIREKETKGEPVSMLFLIDTYTPFPQMHSLQWDVNKLFIERYNWGFFSGEISIFSDTHAFGTLRDRSLPGIATNAKLDPTSQWNDFATTQHVDPRTGIGMITLFNIKSPLAYDWTLAIDRAVKNIKQNPHFKYLLVYCYNSQIEYTGTAEHDPTDKTYGLVQELQRVSPVPINGVMNIAINEESRSFTFNGTFVVTENGTPGLGGKISQNLVCLSFADTTNDYSSHELANLPAALKNTQYINDLKFARDAARKATMNDPVIGYTEAVPESMNGLHRPCMGGSCAIGSLFTDSYMWKLDVDIALQNSAGLRGPGWAAGGVKVSYTWASMPWPNTLGVATLTGLSVWKMLNHSYSVPISTTYYAQGEFYLQSSGLRVRYNMNLKPTKLVAVDVRNRTTGAWEPLDRLKLYRVTIPNYEQFYMEPYTTIFQSAQYEGEVAGVNDPTLVIQAVLQEYLKATTSSANYKKLDIAERAVVDSTATEPMLWEHTKESCGPDSFWREAVGTCFPCPDGYVQPQIGQIECVLPENTSSHTAAIAVGVVVPVVVLSALIVTAILVSRHLKVANAPKDVSKFHTMFVQLKEETLLWERQGSAMPRIMTEYHQIVKKAAADNKCYIVKRIGGATLIAANTSEQILDCAADASRALRSMGWNKLLNREPRSAAKLDQSDRNSVQRRGSMPRKSTALRAVNKGDSRTPSISSKRDTDGSVSSMDETTDNVQFSVGVHFDNGISTYNEAQHSYDYSGPAVDGAAIAADKAHGDQILVTDKVSQKGQYSSAFMEFCTSDWGKGTVLHQFNIPGMAVRSFNVTDDADDAKVDSIAAILEQQSAGVTKKRAIIVSIHMNSIQEKANTLPAATFARHLTSKLEQIRLIVKEQKGHIHSFLGSCLTISFNAVNPTPQATLRACTVIQQIKDLEASGDYQISAGLASETSLVGSLQIEDWKVDTIVSKAHEMASLLQRSCEKYHETHCLIQPSLHDELNLFSVVECVDVIRSPDSAKPRLLLSLHNLKEREEGEEWMYSIEHGDASNPYFAVNELFVKILRDNTVSVDSIQQQVSALPSETNAYVGYQNLNKFVECFQQLNGDRDAAVEEYLARQHKMLV